MPNHPFSKIFLITFLIWLTPVSHATETKEQLKALLAENNAKKKAIIADNKIIEAAIALLEGKTVASTITPVKATKDSPEKSEVDAKQDAKIAALTAGTLDDNNLTGDVLKMRVNSYPFQHLGSDEEFYAPVDAKARVKKDLGDSVLVDFKNISKTRPPVSETYSDCLNGEKQKPDGTACGTKLYSSVKQGEQYAISRGQLDRFNYKRRGIVYGGLVVPFKYYLGGDKRISASSTVAPYVGIRGLGHVYGSHITPVFSAGLGLVPVNTKTTGDDGKVSTTTDTKSALSVATGLVFTSEKNKAFTAGILIGKDFLSSADRLSDPTVDKLWTSLYIGLNVNGKK